MSIVASVYCMPMRAPLHITVLICLFGSVVTAGQEEPNNATETRGFEFLPGAPLLPPLIANPQEPRVGLRKEIGTSRLKLDIGASLDLLGYSFDDDHTQQVRFGADFFTYALTTSAQGLRLQVDAVDGFFGGHIVYQSQGVESVVGLRLRLMHLSAHLVDGHIDPSTQTWRDNRAPLPFTRDFGELLGFYACSLGPLDVMPYAGFSYATLVRPSSIKRWQALGGVEITSGESFGNVFGKPFELYLADNLTLAGVPEWVGTNIFEMGTKFGGWRASGLRLYINYASGLELFSQYYNVRNSRWGIGFAFDVR
jgi:hypothetical protein